MLRHDAPSAMLLIAEQLSLTDMFWILDSTALVSRDSACAWLTAACAHGCMAARL
eukprot:SAG11_NODE_2527_length_3253_cov_1.733756_5_plen_55_part_00